MSHQTAPEDRISFPHKVVYGIGGFVNNLLASAIGGMAIILTLALGVSPALVGLLGLFPRIFDAITDPLVGYISDNTKSRWGRRRPFIFVGAIFTGIVFALLWQIPAPAQFRLKLVDYGADGVYSGVHAVQEETEAVGVAQAVSGFMGTTRRMDDVEHEVVITPPTLVTGQWVGIDVPLASFDQLTTRDHLAQILISGDLENVYLDNIYLYREGDAGARPDASPQEDADGATTPASAAPTPTVPAEDVISLFSDAYESVPVGYFSTDWDRSDVEDAVAGGDPVKRYYNLRFAGIDFGEQTVDASEMTHVHLDIWTPDETPEGRSDMYYFWHFLIGSLVFFLGYTIFATPWVALGYELTPAYNERTRLMGVQNFISNFAFIIAPWFLVIMTNPDWFRNQIDGAKFLALMVCIATIALGVLPALLLRERVAPAPAAAASDESKGFAANVGDFLSGLLKTVKSGPFLLLCLATFLIFNSFIMISSFQIFVFIYHISGGNQVDGAWLAGIVGTVGIVAGFGAIVIVTWLGTRIGKRRAFFVSTGISMLGYALKWFSYHPEYPMLALLPAPFLAFGLSGLFTLMGSMIADVVDLDELQNMDAQGRSERREGMFGSIYWWVVKVGQAVALGLGGYLLVATGFDIDLGGNQAAQTLVMMRAFDAFIPLLASGVAIYAIAKFPITEEMARRTREELERRRGGGAAVA